MSAKLAIRSYQDLLVWNRAMDLAVLVYRLTKLLPTEERFGLQSQARRAATSIPANIAEGKGRRHLGEYLNSLSVARGSLQELETQVHLMIRLDHVRFEDAAPILRQADELGRMLSGLTRSLRRRADTE